MENPLCGSYNRERTVLTFRQRSLEVNAAYLAMAGGALMAFIGLGKELGLSLPLPLDSMWWIFFGALFAVSGLWAYLLFRQLRFDLRKRFYTDRASVGGRVSVRKGSIDDVYCLELGRYQGLLPTGRPHPPTGAWGAPGTPQGPGYPPAGSLLVVRLWWKDPTRPPVVVEHLVVGAAYGTADQRAMHFLGLAQGYAQALRVPLTGSL